MWHQGKVNLKPGPNLIKYAKEKAVHIICATNTVLRHEKSSILSCKPILYWPDENHELADLTVLFSTEESDEEEEEEEIQPTGQQSRRGSELLRKGGQWYLFVCMFVTVYSRGLPGHKYHPGRDWDISLTPHPGRDQDRDWD